MLKHKTILVGTSQNSRAVDTGNKEELGALLDEGWAIIHSVAPVSNPGGQMFALVILGKEEPS